MTTRKSIIDRDNPNDGRNAAYTAVFATFVMTGYLWTQIVAGLVPPVA